VLSHLLLRLKVICLCSEILYMPECLPFLLALFLQSNCWVGACK
jgi:hypothetical protein